MADRLATPEEVARFLFARTITKHASPIHPGTGTGQEAHAGGRGVGEPVMPFHQSGVKAGVIKVQRNDGEWVRFWVKENTTSGGRVELEVVYLEGEGPTVINYQTWHEVFDADTAILVEREVNLGEIEAEYRGQHQPSGSYGAPAHDLTMLVAEDIYTHPHYYPGGDEYPGVVAMIRRVRGKPDAMVRVYRAVPKGVTEINPGDWVTPSEKYAKLHGESSGWLREAAPGEMQLDPTTGFLSGGTPAYDIISREVPARELIWPGDYLPEWGWFPNATLEEINKHGQGSHDDKSHGNWATGGKTLIGQKGEKLYHASVRRNRESIRSEGLRLSDIDREHLWLTANPKEIAHFSMLEFDIWEVDVEGLPLYREFHPGLLRGPENTRVLHETIPASRLKLYRQYGRLPAGISARMVQQWDGTKWVSSVAKHMGPGPHPSGSEQTAHAGEVHGNPTKLASDTTPGPLTPFRADLRELPEELRDDVLDIFMEGDVYELPDGTKITSQIISIQKMFPHGDEFNPPQYQIDGVFVLEPAKPYKAWDSDQAGTWSRVLHPDQGEIYNSLLSIRTDLQGNGLGLRFLHDTATKAAEHGWKKMTVFAAGDGVVAWARFGYDWNPDHKESYIKMFKSFGLELMEKSASPSQIEQYRQVVAKDDFAPYEIMAVGDEARKVFKRVIQGVEGGGHWEGELDLSAFRVKKIWSPAYIQLLGRWLSTPEGAAAVEQDDEEFWEEVRALAIAKHAAPIHPGTGSGQEVHGGRSVPEPIQAPSKRIARLLDKIRDTGTVDFARDLWDDAFDVADLSYGYDLDDLKEKDIPVIKELISAQSQKVLRQRGHGDTIRVFRAGRISTPWRAYSTTLRRNTAETFASMYKMPIVEYEVAISDVLYYSEALWSMGTFAEEEIGVLARNLKPVVAKHMGPGPHPSGSDQTVHGHGRTGQKTHSGISTNTLPYMWESKAGVVDAYETLEATPAERFAHGQRVLEYIRSQRIPWEGQEPTVYPTFTSYEEAHANVPDWKKGEWRYMMEMDGSVVTRLTLEMTHYDSDKVDYIELLEKPFDLDAPIPRPQLRPPANALEEEYGVDPDDPTMRHTWDYVRQEQLAGRGDEARAWYDESVNNYQKQRDARLLRDLSTGDLTKEDVLALSAHLQYNNDFEKTAPLPSEVYHVTTNVEGVLATGFKTRAELAQRQGLGLGGGPDDTVSFTENLPAAREILASMQERHDLLNGRITAEDLKARAEAGVGADPIRARSRFGTNGYWSKSAEEAYETYKADPSIENLGSFHNAFSLSRDMAGGPMDPLFIFADEEAFRQVPRSSIGIIKAKARQGKKGPATGHQVGGSLGEWRTFTGQAVQDLEVVK